MRTVERRRCDNDDGREAGGRSAFEHRRQIGVKTAIVEMSVGVDPFVNHDYIICSRLRLALAWHGERLTKTGKRYARNDRPCIILLNPPSFWMLPSMRIRYLTIVAILAALVGLYANSAQTGAKKEAAVKKSNA